MLLAASRPDSSFPPSPPQKNNVSDCSAIFILEYFQVGYTRHDDRVLGFGWPIRGPNHEVDRGLSECTRAAPENHFGYDCFRTTPLSFSTGDHPPSCRDLANGIVASGSWLISEDHTGKYPHPRGVTVIVIHSRNCIDSPFDSDDTISIVASREEAPISVNTAGCATAPESMSPPPQLELPAHERATLSSRTIRRPGITRRARETCIRLEGGAGEGERHQKPRDMRVST